DRSDLRRTTFSASSSWRQRGSHRLRSQSLWARLQRASKTCVAGTKSKYLVSDDPRATRCQSWWLTYLHRFLLTFTARRSSCNCRSPCSPADCSRLLSRAIFMKRFSMTRIDLHGTLSRFQFCYFTGLQYCASTAAEPGFSATKQTTSALFFCRNTPGPAGEVTTPATM